VVAEVRDGDQVWGGATGVADITTGRPVTDDMRHRVGSITKSFTAAAVLQQVECGRIGLDSPIGHYLPRLVPGERGDAITVRMLLNHTSGLAEYLPPTRRSRRSPRWRTRRPRAWTTTGSRGSTRPS
jgi:D-alanyl-D-alanine carboxypeptidase